jgi:hypothetical protein
LQVGVARHDDLFILLRELEHGDLNGTYLCQDSFDLTLDEEAQIQRDLIVAAARGVQFPGHSSNPLCQSRFDIHVHIFK